MAVAVGQAGHIQLFQPESAAQFLGEVLAGHGDEETAVFLQHPSRFI
ncbi:MAG: hypothetical protein M5U34_11230 [Chloroflexi bacterium]|nr:hypothetical protein [Chloroflexota bacterium]